jgi:dephospho-CoA kinase
VAPEGAPTDRGRIGGIVFADPEELAWLESKIHPAVGVETAAWIAGLPDEVEVAVIEVPLLVEGREARQLEQDEKARRAEHVVENDGTVADLEGRLSALLARLRE